MSVQILNIEKESWPAARLIGKRYEGSTNWEEWWANNWFEALEAANPLPLNGDAYIGAVHIADGRPERWIGMFFPENTAVPAGFDYIEIDPLSYAVCYLYGEEGSAEFYSTETHEQCLNAIKARGFRRKEDHWCFERYNCPRFTSPDDKGRVILDYGISIEG